MKILDAGASGQGFSVKNRPMKPLTLPRISVRYWLAIFMLFLACFLWGIGNVAQKIVLNDISPLLLLCIRSTIALICLTPFAINECRKKKISLKHIWCHSGWLAVTALSFALGLACQTFGGQFTSATNLGFIINLCVLITPLILFLAFRERISPMTLFSCAVCFAGAALLTSLPMQKPNLGDALCFIGAIFYAVWIVSLDRSLKVIDAPILITVLQFAPASLLSLGLALPQDELYSVDFWPLWPTLLFISILSTCVGFLMAAYAQRLVQPVIAGLIYSFEALFGAAGAWFVLDERLSNSAMIGGAMMFASILVCQYCVSKPSTQNKHSKLIIQLT